MISSVVYAAIVLTPAVRANWNHAPNTLEATPNITIPTELLEEAVESPTTPAASDLLETAVSETVSETVNQSASQFQEALAGKNHGHNPHRHNPHRHNPHLHTRYPTSFPTSYPTGFPTEYPTRFPTTKPTEYPTPQPTEYPTPHPTEYPTAFPTKNPTEYPTANPTSFPSTTPTKSPGTLAPTYKTFSRIGDVCVTSQDPKDVKSMQSFASKKNYIIQGCLNKCKDMEACVGFDVGYAKSSPMCMLMTKPITGSVTYSASPASLQPVPTGTPAESTPGNGGSTTIEPEEREFGCYVLAYVTP